MAGCRFYTLLVVVLALSFISIQSKKAGEILDCIIRKVPKVELVSRLQNICAKDVDDKECPKTVYGMNQCFLLNECYNKNLEEDMDVHCWNCWVDFTTESHVVSEYQDQFRLCNWSNNLTFAFFALLSFIFAILLA